MISMVVTNEMRSNINIKIGNTKLGQFFFFFFCSLEIEGIITKNNCYTAELKKRITLDK